MLLHTRKTHHIALGAGLTFHRHLCMFHGGCILNAEIEIDHIGHQVPGSLAQSCPLLSGPPTVFSYLLAAPVLVMTLRISRRENEDPLRDCNIDLLTHVYQVSFPDQESNLGPYIWE